jgi:hypothetical protein
LNNITSGWAKLIDKHILEPRRQDREVRRLIRYGIERSKPPTYVVVGEPRVPEHAEEERLGAAVNITPTKAPRIEN